MKRRVTLRPKGRGKWRPLVIDVIQLPRKQGQLFRRDDSDTGIVKLHDTWVLDGREWRVAGIEDLKP